MNPPPDSALRPARRFRKSLRWTLAVLSGLVILLLVGVYLGAQHPHAWYTRTARWLGTLF